MSSKACSLATDPFRGRSQELPNPAPAVAFDCREIYTSELDPRARHMRRHRIAFPLSVLLLALAGGQALAGPPAPPISGVVRHLETPVSGVLVIVLNLGDNSLARVRTATDGTFVLSSAPAGVYELVAYKRGFEPALQRLWHQAGVRAGLGGVDQADEEGRRDGARGARPDDHLGTARPPPDRRAPRARHRRSRRQVHARRREGAPLAPARGRAEDHDGSAPGLLGRALARGGGPEGRPAERLAVRHHGRLLEARGFRHAGRGDDGQRRRPRPRSQPVGRRARRALDAAQHPLVQRRAREPPDARRELERGGRAGPRRIRGRALRRGDQPLPRDRARHDDLPARLAHVGSQRQLQPAVHARHAGRRGRHGLPAHGRERRPVGRRRRRRVRAVRSGCGPRRIHRLPRLRRAGDGSGRRGALHRQREHRIRHRPGRHRALHDQPDHDLRARPLPRAGIHDGRDGRDAARDLHRGEPRSRRRRARSRSACSAASGAIRRSSSRRPSSGWASSCAPSSRATS